MKRLIPLLLITICSCSNNSPNNNPPKSNIIKKDSATRENIIKPSVAYEVINKPDNTSNLVFDIYVKDTTKIKILNDYLVSQYNLNKKDFISINYFNNRKVAKTYFKKIFSESVSEDEKDRIFNNYVAVYKFNPTTGFDKLSFLHQ